MTDLITKLDDYLKQWPIIFLNYDEHSINVIKIYLFRYFVDKTEGLNAIDAQ